MNEPERRLICKMPVDFLKIS